MLSICSSHLIPNIGLLETSFPHPACLLGPNGKWEFETSKVYVTSSCGIGQVVRGRPKRLVKIKSLSVNLEDELEKETL